MSVADFNVDRISQFSPDGTFIRAFGLDVDPAGGAGPEKCTTATGCKPGLATDDAGSAASVRALAHDAAGNIYATHPNLHRVSVFDGDGDFLRAFGFDVIPGGPAGLETCTVATTCQAGTPGIAAGQFSTPAGIDVVGNEVFVSNFSGGTVGVYSTAGAFLRTIGTGTGSGAGQLSSIEGLTVEGGDVYVGDYGNRRRQPLHGRGHFRRRLRKGCGPRRRNRV